MTRQELLAYYVDGLPEGWKWDRLFTPPDQLASEWQVWLANAQRAELAASLRFWAERGERAA